MDSQASPSFISKIFNGLKSLFWQQPNASTHDDTPEDESNQNANHNTKPSDDGVNSSASDSSSSGVFFYSSQPRREQHKEKERRRPEATGNEAMDEFINSLYAHLPHEINFCPEDRRKLEAHQRRKQMWLRIKKKFGFGNRCSTCGTHFADGKKKFMATMKDSELDVLGNDDDHSPCQQVDGKRVSSHVFCGLEMIDMTK